MIKQKVLLLSFCAALFFLSNGQMLKNSPKQPKDQDVKDKQVSQAQRRSPSPSSQPVSGESPSNPISPVLTQPTPEQYTILGARPKQSSRSLGLQKQPLTQQKQSSQQRNQRVFSQTETTINKQITQIKGYPTKVGNSRDILQELKKLCQAVLNGFNGFIDKFKGNNLPFFTMQIGAKKRQIRRQCGFSMTALERKIMQQKRMKEDKFEQSQFFNLYTLPTDKWDVFNLGGNLGRSQSRLSQWKLDQEPPKKEDAVPPNQTSPPPESPKVLRGEAVSQKSKSSTTQPRVPLKKDLQSKSKDSAAPSMSKHKQKAAKKAAAGGNKARGRKQTQEDVVKQTVEKQQLVKPPPPKIVAEPEVKVESKRGSKWKDLKECSNYLGKLVNLVQKTNEKVTSLAQKLNSRADTARGREDLSLLARIFAAVLLQLAQIHEFVKHKGHGDEAQKILSQLATTKQSIENMRAELPALEQQPKSSCISLKQLGTMIKRVGVDPKCFQLVSRAPKQITRAREKLAHLRKYGEQICSNKVLTSKHLKSINYKRQEADQFESSMTKLLQQLAQCDPEDEPSVDSLMKSAMKILGSMGQIKQKIDKVVGTQLDSVTTQLQLLKTVNTITVAAQEIDQIVQELLKAIGKFLSTNAKWQKDEWKKIYLISKAILTAIGQYLQQIAPCKDMYPQKVAEVEQSLETDRKMIMQWQQLCFKSTPEGFLPQDEAITLVEARESMKYIGVKLQCVKFADAAQISFADLRKQALRLQSVAQNYRKDKLKDSPPTVRSEYILSRLDLISKMQKLEKQIVSILVLLIECSFEMYRKGSFVLSLFTKVVQDLRRVLLEQIKSLQTETFMECPQPPPIEVTQQGFTQKTQKQLEQSSMSLSVRSMWMQVWVISEFLKTMRSSLALLSSHNVGQKITAKIEQEIQTLKDQASQCLKQLWEHMIASIETTLQQNIVSEQIEFVKLLKGYIQFSRILCSIYGLDYAQEEPKEKAIFSIQVTKSAFGFENDVNSLTLFLFLTKIANTARRTAETLLSHGDFIADNLNRTNKDEITATIRKMEQQRAHIQSIVPQVSQWDSKQRYTNQVRTIHAIFASLQAKLTDLIQRLTLAMQGIP